MAKATTEKTVTKVVLELDNNEADTLAAMFGSVGGHPDHSARGYVDRVSAALRKAGFSWEKSRFYEYKTGDGFDFKDHTTEEI